MDFLNIFLNKNDNDPLYYQLYTELVNRIQTQQMQVGEKLPGKRTAAQQLGVSVNTVDEAYQMLAAEGYVTAQPRSGFVVNRLWQVVPMPGTMWQEGPDDVETQSLLPQETIGQWRYSFSTGGLDPTLFPHKTWGRLMREVLGEGEQLFARGEGMGDEVLRRAIVGYLQGYRGVRCGPQQVVVGAGLEVLVSMLARLLAQDTFAVEDPGYPKTRHLLQNMGVAMRAVQVDEGGMIPEMLEKSGASAAYLTPSHQFPTGGVMPVGRRTALLQWAAAGRRVIVEDDYDSEFRFDGRPLPCLQGLDKSEKVVYAGTFSRALAPGLRAAYLVLPGWLLARWRAAYGDYACSVSRPEQHTLARLIGQGHFARSLNRVRGVYRQRRDRMIEAMRSAMGGREMLVENSHTGLYFVLRLPGQNAAGLAAAAREKGLLVRALDEYREQRPPESQTADALVVGYGGLAEGDIESAAEQLAAQIKEYEK